jgi:hypothetical protein
LDGDCIWYELMTLDPGTRNARYVNKQADEEGIGWRKKCGKATMRRTTLLKLRGEAMDDIVLVWQRRDAEAQVLARNNRSQHRSRVGIGQIKIFGYSRATLYNLC